MAPSGQRRVVVGDRGYDPGRIAALLDGAGVDVVEGREPEGAVNSP